MRRALRALLLLGLAAPAALGAWLYVGIARPYKGYEAAEQFVEIPPGSSSVSIARRLEDAGVVRSAVAFRAAVWLRGANRRLQAGEYRFDAPMTAAAVADKLRRGDVYLQAITFPEGLTIRQMSELFERRGLGSAREFAAAARDASLIATLDPRAPDLEGYLFPDTYALRRGANAGELVRQMVAAFRKALTPELRREAEARGLSVREHVALASLIEKETGRPEERALVAAVYVNRLRIGMALYCDPTVIYALERAGRYTGNLTRDDLRFDSPYNTYRYAGLPPGPIAAPGRASLEAAVRPASVPYLYFVSRNDGSHVFATTLEEHNRNVFEFQKRPFNRQ